MKFSREFGAILTSKAYLAANCKRENCLILFEIFSQLRRGKEYEEANTNLKPGVTLGSWF
jgi:hypothetical protein